MLLTTLQLVSLFFGHNDIPCLQMGRLSTTHVLFSGSADERLPVLMMGGPKNSTLNAGFLPCRRQTVFRAEFQADIYTDNRAVDRIVNHLLVTGDSREVDRAPGQRLDSYFCRFLSYKPRGATTVTWITVKHAARWTLLETIMIFG